MKKISYSQYSSWAQCPYKWKLGYADDLRTFNGNIFTIFGSAIHEVLQTYLTVMYNDTVKVADALPLDEMLLHRMKHHYVELMENNGGEVICEQSDMEEFYGQGIAMLEWFKKRRGEYFSKRGYELVGIETELDYELPNNIKFVGFLDVVIKDTVRDVIKIYDIKTSTMGWNKYMKADKLKSDQLLLYKQFYSKQFNHPIEKIEVEFFIVKRKLYENVDFPQRRVQKFVPANGTPSVNQTISRLNEFITECFTNEGEYNIEHTYRKDASKKACRFCEFNQTEHCDAGIKS